MCEDAVLLAKIVSGDLAQEPALKGEAWLSLLPLISFAFDLLNHYMPPGRSVADILEEFWGEMPSWSGRYAQCVGTLNRVVNSRASGAIVGSKIALDAACGYVGFADGKSLYAVRMQWHQQHKKIILSDIQRSMIFV